ncbi:AMP-binding protein, partial [Pseudoalteromonas luteoviolacea]|uniref:AMP-binding protein n=1 Tax=Pseudoalteromonas luteoviolacea TaxID=43657 RepID=UPI001F384CCE
CSTVNMAMALKKAFEVHDGSRVLQFASMSFDASVSEWVVALLSGACLYLVSEDVKESPELLQSYMQQRQITHATLPPAYFRHFRPQANAPIQNLILAGENFDLDLVRDWHGKLNIYNAYGPSEATVCTSIQELNEHHVVLGIGQAITNVQTYILDKQQQLVPPGVVGELYTGGVGLARGYLNKPELTAERFIVNPFYDSNLPSSSPRLYRTGDLVRYLPDGSLAFIGRI